MQFYRYEAVQYATTDHDGEYMSPLFPNPKVELRTFNLHKETPKGYWIGYGHMYPGFLKSQARWVSKTSRKRYAYPTKEEALKNFIARNERRVKILSWQIESCKAALQVAKNIKT